MRGDRAWERQRLVRRSGAYFYAPSGVVLVALLILCWEVFRANLPVAATSRGFYSLSLLGIGPSVAIFAGGLALLLGRSQFALANRPHVTGSSDVADDDRKWRLWLYNAGAGHCVVLKVRWQLVACGSSIDTTSHQELARFIESGCLSGGLAIRNVSPGAPLPAVKVPADGLALVVLDLASIAQVERLKLMIRVRDVVGDEYEWRRDFAQVFP